MSLENITGKVLSSETSKHGLSPHFSTHLNIETNKRKIKVIIEGVHRIDVGELIYIKYEESNLNLVKAYDILNQETKELKYSFSKP